MITIHGLITVYSAQLEEEVKDMTWSVVSAVGHYNLREVSVSYVALNLLSEYNTRIGWENVFGGSDV